MIAAGYAGTLWCYAAMGDAWRMGVNHTETTTLVTRGPYRRVRHPIYLFQIVILLGVALLLPTVLSLVILGVHLLCVLVKAADEESYLLTAHGQTYRDYFVRTGKLFPKWIGRRPG
jgi:protein-S-isoprenylcysteine O-methyltransferase Ste14